MSQLYQQCGQPGETCGLNFDKLRQERLMLSTPDRVIDQVLADYREFGAEFRWFSVCWPGMELHSSLETIQIFGERVIPAIKRSARASAVH